MSKNSRKEKQKDGGSLDSFFYAFIFKVAFIEVLRNIKEAPRMNKIKANSIETGRAVIAHLFSRSDQEICSALCFSLTCALIGMIYWFMNDAKLI